MTHIEAMAAIAQGVINIQAAGRTKSGETTGVASVDALAGTLDTIEHGSRIFRGMEAIVNEEQPTIDRLRHAERLLRRRGPGDAAEALEIVERLLAERTDPEFGHLT